MRNPNISLQLYTLRHEIEKDFSGSLERAAAIGFSQVEPWNFVAQADNYAKAFTANGITAPSAHAHLGSIGYPKIARSSVRRQSSDRFGAFGKIAQRQIPMVGFPSSTQRLMFLACASQTDQWSDEEVHGVLLSIRSAIRAIHVQTVAKWI